MDNMTKSWVRKQFRDIFLLIACALIVGVWIGVGFA